MAKTDGCSFCEKLNKLNAQVYHEHPIPCITGEIQVRYHVSLVQDTYFRGLQYRRVTCHNNKLKFCPECGRKL